MPRANVTSPVQTKNEQTEINAPVVNAAAPVVNEAPPVDANEAPAVDANVPPVDAPPAAPEVPAYMQPILAARATEDAANEVKKNDLELALETAQRAYVAALTADNFKQTEGVIAASLGVKSASDNIEKFAAEVKLAISARDEEDVKMVSKYDLADKFGISLDKIAELLAQPDEFKKVLKASFASVFGKPDLHIKAGVTSKQLTANKPASSAAADSNGAADSSDKWAECIAALESGLTHKELLQLFPTRPKDQPVNYSKLNGTMRTVISKEGYERDETTDKYVKVAK